MPETDNQAVKSSRDLLAERASARFPERNFSMGPGADGANETDDLEQAIIEMLDEQGKTIDENKSKNDALLQMFKTDPKSAEFVNKWIESGDPRIALVETFGDDLSELATEEGRGRFSDQLKDWRSRRDEESKLNEEADANWEDSLNRLNAFGDERGLDNDQKAKIMGRLIAIAANGMQNKYENADFEMVLKDTNYEADINNARREGEISGRNARINSERRSRNASGAMPPALGGGQGMRVPADTPKKPYNPWDEIK